MSTDIEIKSDGIIEDRKKENFIGDYQKENICLVIRNVIKEYYMGKNIVRALNHTNLTILKKKLVVILGPSGSGKTTLLNMIGALDVVSEGSIKVLEYDITKMTRKELSKFRRNHLGFIFQFFNLIPTLTAIENVEYALQIRGERNSTLKAMKTLKEVELDHRANHFPSELSGGEQQRVAIARALVKSPELILADEPTGELDYETGIKILYLLRKVVNTGKTVVIVTHNSEIAKIADVILHIRGGKIVSQEIIPNPQNPSELKW